MSWTLAITFLTAAAVTWLGLIFPGQYAAGLLAFAAATALTLNDPKSGLHLLIFSMLLSPELALGQAGTRPITIRYDDIMLLSVFISWFAMTSVNKELPFLRYTRAHLPIICYISVCVLATALGILRGNLNPVKAIFYTAKYIQYFAIFFMAVNLLDSDGEIKKVLRYGLITALLVTAYAYNYHYQTGDRTTAPFDDALYGVRTISEPGTLGAYYIVVAGALMGIATEIAPAGALAIAGLLLFMFPAFLQTLSRASYVGMCVCTLMVLFLARSRKIGMAAAMLAVCGLALASPAIRDATLARIGSTFQGGQSITLQEVEMFGYKMELEESAAERVKAWKRILYKKFPEHPLLGHGVTGIGFEDTQYGLILGELGLVGLFIFGWMCAAVFVLGAAALRQARQPWARGLAMGFIAGFAGLLAHALTSNTFIIIKVMEPFWLLAAVVAVIAGGRTIGRTEIEAEPLDAT